MDPTEAELGAIADLAGAKAWAGIQEPIDAPLGTALGDPARIRDIALIARPVWDQAVGAVLVPGAGGGAGRALNPVEGARVESYRRVCLLRVGRAPDSPGDLGLPGPAIANAALPPAGGGGQAPAGPGNTTRKLKLSAVLDPTLDAEIVAMSPAEISQAYQDYAAKFGDQPGAEYDPSPDQLSALRQVVEARAVPYADFSVFGPFGNRRLRRQVYTSYQLNAATGEWTKKEQPGPPGFHEWYQTWKTYRCALLLLNVCDAVRLDAYSEHIRGYLQQFSEEAWFLIYRADVRLRSEQLERIRRALRQNPQHGFTEASPWGACFTAATKDSDFWSKELITPATLWLSTHKKRGHGRGGRGRA